MTCAAYEIKTGLSGDGMTLSLPRNDEIASLDASTEATNAAFGEISTCRNLWTSLSDAGASLELALAAAETSAQTSAPATMLRTGAVVIVRLVFIKMTPAGASENLPRDRKAVVSAIDIRK